MPITSSDAFLRLINSLEEAASASRQLAFLRGQQLWLGVDERILTMRKLCIEMYEAAETAERFKQ